MIQLLAALLVAYLGWWLWQGPKKSHRPVRPESSADDRAARAVLGVGSDADVAEIRAAHRRLIAAAHPDHGGSSDLTGRINAARDVLLKPRD